MNARTPALDVMDRSISLSDLFTACEQLQASGTPDEALNLYQSWLGQSLDPNRHLAWFNYGSLLQRLAKTQEAVQAYSECLLLQPSFPHALINIGLCLEKLGLRNEALQRWAALVSHRLLQDAPPADMLVLALNHIGRVHEDLKQFDLAQQALEQSLAIDPKQPSALQHWIHIRQKACAWPVYKPLPNITPNDMRMATSPLAMLALTDDPVQQLLTAHAFVERTYSFKQEYLSKGRQYQHDRIRVGYVSGDLCIHAVGLLLPELFEGHDRSAFEIYGYDFSPEDGSDHRERLKNAFDHLRSIHTLTDRQVAEQILRDEIDVLIDLHGLSSGARPGIFALHPAPIQGTYLGFIGTTGMPWFDFVIADRTVLTHELTPYFTEKPLYIEGSFIPTKHSDPDLKKANRNEFDFPEDAFIMAGFVNAYKLNEGMFNTWINILKRVDNSYLWLIDENPVTTSALKKYTKIQGIDTNRIKFSIRSSVREFHSRIKLADIFLDSFPYNCGSTTSDVISCGTPVVTLSGRTMVSRMGSSFLNSLNLHELITYNHKDYEDLAVHLAQSNQYLHSIKNSIKNNLAAKKNNYCFTSSLELKISELFSKQIY